MVTVPSPDGMTEAWKSKASGLVWSESGTRRNRGELAFKLKESGAWAGTGRPLRSIKWTMTVPRSTMFNPERGLENVMATMGSTKSILELGRTSVSIGGLTSLMETEAFAAMDFEVHLPSASKSPALMTTG